MRRKKKKLEARLFREVHELEAARAPDLQRIERLEARVAKLKSMNRSLREQVKGFKRMPPKLVLVNDGNSWRLKRATA